MAQTTLTDYRNNLFSNHFLKERIQEMDEWEELNFEEKFNELRTLYNEKKHILTEELNEDQTQNRFIDPVLRKLGHDWVEEAQRRVGSKDGKTLNPDYAFMQPSDTPKVIRDEEDAFKTGYALGDAKAWNKKLDRSTRDHNNPAFQIYNYVDRLRTDWGILTNGKKWRLYSYEDCAADVYFEIDLEELLSGDATEEKLEIFKYFYLFFSADSFETEFLDHVYQQSITYSKSLEDDLENKVYDALEVSVKGFFETNDIEKTEENIDTVHRSSLILLYRMLFILNAESRKLLPVENDIYRSQLSFEELKEKLMEEEQRTFPENTWLWQERISTLFDAINNGKDYGDFEIPAYNGGLFSEEETKENKFLSNNQLRGDHIKQILDLLATTKVENQKVLVDYKDLNIRHLGSVYEGLLEHEFKAAEGRKVLNNGEWQDFSDTDKEWSKLEDTKRVEDGELYLTNESGERKATGSYYTPEYIVEYIVENTVEPKVEKKIKQAQKNGEDILPKILELNVCDPAMGSGHFLTEATEHIAEHIVEHANLEKQDIDENEDELNWAKRQVVQNCIYGVDVNELAVELGKLSLWIETAARGKPLNFLDHHLKHGNSLIGSDFDEIFSHPTEDQKRLDSDRYEFGDPQDIKQSFQEQYLEIEEMPENTVEQIHEKEQAYKQFIQENVLYQQFNQLANIHTRQYFEKEANSSDYESFLINIGNPGNPFENTEWYKNAQKDAENRNYFHWQLEFPKVFFGEKEGFDAVIGNPPYFDIETTLDMPMKDYLSEEYSVYTGSNDVCYFFYERAFENLRDHGEFGMITSRYFMEAAHSEKLRSYLSDFRIREIVDFGSEVKVFHDSSGEEITIHTLTMMAQKSESSGEFTVTKFDDWPVEKNNIGALMKFVEKLPSDTVVKPEYRRFNYSNELLDENEWNLEPPVFSDILGKMRKMPYRIGDEQDKKEAICSVGQSIQSGMDRVEEDGEEKGVFRLTEKEINDLQIEEELLRPLIKTAHIRPYLIKDPEEYLIYLTPDHNIDDYPNTKEHLMTYKEELASRYDIKNSSYPWYSIANLRNQEMFEKKCDKIVWPMVAPENRFALKKEERRLAFTGDVYYAVPKEKFLEGNEDLTSFLLGISNSALMTFFHRKTAKATNWGHSFGSGYVSEYPIPEPSSAEGYSQIAELAWKVTQNREKELKERMTFLEWVEAEWGVDVDDLSLKTHLREYWEYDFDEFMRVAKKNKSQIDGSVKSREFRELMKEEWENSMDTLRPLMQEIDKLENEIDAIVFDLYDLTEEEVETVLDSLDTGEGEKASILEEFEEVRL